MKYILLLIFVGISALISFGQAQCQVTCGDGFCPPSDDKLEYDECCKYFKDACCTHDQNQKLKTIFIVVVVLGVLSFVGMIACVVGIIACCCCACAAAPSSRRTVVTTTGYAPVPTNVVIANNTTTTTKPL